MLEFLKMFGMGIVYTILSPLILVFFLVFVVYSVFNYLVFECINLGGFFFGRKFTAETQLEKKLAQMKKGKSNNVAEVKQVETPIENSEVTTSVVENKDGDLHD